MTAAETEERTIDIVLAELVEAIIHSRSCCGALRSSMNTGPR
jgi:hypothetical protein